MAMSCPANMSFTLAKEPGIASFGVMLGFLFSSILQPRGNRGYSGA